MLESQKILHLLINFSTFQNVHRLLAIISNSAWVSPPIIWFYPKSLQVADIRQFQTHPHTTLWVASPFLCRRNCSQQWTTSCSCYLNLLSTLKSSLPIPGSSFFTFESFKSLHFGARIHPYCPKMIHGFPSAAAQDRLALQRCLVELQKKKEAKPELIRKAPPLGG